MTNVAIAMPRSPMHLANTAYDLQLMSGGRFRLGLGSQIKPHIEKRYGADVVAAGRPDARDRARGQGDPRVLAGRHPAALRGRAHPAHADAADVRARPQPVRRAAGAARRARPGDDPDRRRGRRRPAGDAVPQLTGTSASARCRPSTRGCPAPGATRDDFAILPQAIVAMGRTERGWRPRLGRACAGCSRSTAPRRRTSRCSRPRAGPTCSRSSTGSRRRATSRAMFELVTDEMLETLAVRGTPEECAAEIGRRFGDVAERVCCYFPGYEPPLDQRARPGRGTPSWSRPR